MIISTALFRNWKLLFISALFLTLGLILGSGYQASLILRNDYDLDKNLFKNKENNSHLITASEIIDGLDQNRKYVSAIPVASPNTTIAEVQQIYSDKTFLTLNEEGNFTVTIKNQGAKKKSLAFICFNSSNEDAFYCISGKILLPDEELVLNGSKSFDKKGDYSVWITLSEDGTNFYRPLNSEATTVSVY